jgi:WD40 repeat protein
MRAIAIAHTSEANEAVASAFPQTLSRLEGHSASVWSAAFSPDGQRVVTASDDKTARVWNAATGQVIAKLEDHWASVGSAAFSADGQRVVTASADNTARVFHILTADDIARLLASK